METNTTPQLSEEELVNDLIHTIQAIRTQAGFGSEDRIGLALYMDLELAQILQYYQREIMAETLAINLLLSISQRDYPSFEEVYRERISPDSNYKLAQYTVEVVLGTNVRGSEGL